MLLLTATGLTVFLTSDLFEIPHLPMCGPEEWPVWLPQWVIELRSYDSRFSPFCDSGDVVLWMTILALVLFSGRRWWLWALAPTLCVVALHGWASLRDGLPTVGLEDGSSVIYWERLREMVVLWIACCGLALIVVLTAGAVLRQAARRPELVARTASRTRRAVIVAAIALAVATPSWLLWRRTDAYQFARIRHDAVASAIGSSGPWRAFALEIGISEQELESSAKAAAAADAVPPPPFDFESTCEAPSGPNPWEDAAARIRACMRDGNTAKAVAIWTAATRTLADARGFDKYELKNVLKEIPPEAEVLGNDVLFAGTDVAGADRSERAGALFHGLIRRGRFDEAVAFFRAMPAEASRRSDFLPLESVEDSSARDVLLELDPIAMARFDGEQWQDERNRWRLALAENLASAGDGESALRLAADIDDVPEHLIASALNVLTKEGALERVDGLLAQFDPAGGGYRESREQLCIAKPRLGQGADCIQWLEAQTSYLTARALALSALAKMTSGEREEGVALLDRAEKALNNNQADEDVVAALAEAGRLRRARVIAEGLSDSVARVSAYRAIVHKIASSSRMLGYVTAKVLDAPPLSWIE